MKSNKWQLVLPLMKPNKFGIQIVFQLLQAIYVKWKTFGGGDKLVATTAYDINAFLVHYNIWLQGGHDVMILSCVL